MKRYLAACVLLVLATACRDAALASSDRNANPQVALCAAAHSIPHVLLDWHHQKIDQNTAMLRLSRIRRTIDENASGRYARHLHDVAAAVRVFEIVTRSRGDTSDAYRDLRNLRESLPRCTVRNPTARVAPSPGVKSG